MPIPIGRCWGLGKVVEAALQKKALIDPNDPSWIQQIVNQLKPFAAQGHEITPFDVKRTIMQANPEMASTVNDATIQKIITQLKAGPTAAEQAFEQMGGDEALRGLEMKYNPQYPQTTP